MNVENAEHMSEGSVYSDIALGDEYAYLRAAETAGIIGIDGKKEKFSDASLRPALNLEDYKNAVTENPCTALIAALGKIRQATPGLSYGCYNELMLTNRQYAFARELDNVRVIVSVNYDDNAAGMNLPV